MRRYRFAMRSWVQSFAKSSGLRHKRDSYIPLKSVGAQVEPHSLRLRK
jgi:hypothetical protein